MGPPRRIARGWMARRSGTATAPARKSRRRIMAGGSYSIVEGASGEISMSMKGKDRRTFLKTVGAGALAMGMPGPGPAAAAATVRFGVDMYSLGAQHWTPFEMLDWGARLNVNIVHFTGIRLPGGADWPGGAAPGE